MADKQQRFSEFVSEWDESQWNSMEWRMYLCSRLLEFETNTDILREIEPLYKKQADYIKSLERQLELLQKTLGFAETLYSLEKVKELKFIVHEDNDMPTCSPSSVAIKCYTDKDVYGWFRRVEKPTLTVADVVEATNKLLADILGREQLWLKAKSSIGSN